MTAETWFEVAGFGLGLLFGSFLNVCISRLPGHESIMKPRSRCPKCGHSIRWYDNIPLLSWVVLRAKCRDCGERISWRYPAVELAVGLWFAWHALAFVALYHMRNYTSDLQDWYFYGRQCEILGALILGFLLIGLMVMDWQTLRLPDAFTLPGIGIGFVLTCVQAWFLAPGVGDIVLNTTHQLRLSSPGSFQAQGNVFMTGPEAMVLGRVAAICGAALVLLGVRWAYKALRKREGLGLGDVKLLAMIAAFLGFGQSLLALFVGVLAASIYGLALIARRKASGGSKLPLGSFIAAGGLYAAIYGTGIVSWYMGLLR